jgi:hypothetical protein
MRGDERMAETEYKWHEMEEPQEEEQYDEAEVVRFEEPGTVFMGIYKECIEYTDKETGEPAMFWKFKPLIDGPDQIIFPTSVLKTKMENVEPNTALKIEYVGMQKSKKSRFEYKNFRFYIGD